MNTMLNYIKKNLAKLSLVVFGFLFPVIVFADGSTDPTVTVINPISSNSLTDLIRTILEGVIKIGMPVLVLAIIYCGFLFVSAQGNSEKLNDAKRALMYTLIGAGILLGAWGIAQLITDTVKAL